MAKIAINTHHGQFHCDEVTACALLKAFYATDKDEVFIHRVDWNRYTGSEWKKRFEDLGYDTVFVLDTGREYDPDRLLFDHHQYSPQEMPKSSAGLVFDWLYEKDYMMDIAYNELRPIIDKIDLDDVGLRPAEPWELSWIIKTFNDPRNQFGKKQCRHFYKAVDFVYTMLSGVKRKAQLLYVAEELYDKYQNIWRT